MMICPRCNIVMIRVHRFSPDGSYEFNVCRNCHFETKHKRLMFYSTEIMQDNTECKETGGKKKVESKNKLKKCKKGKRKCTQRM